MLTAPFASDQREEHRRMVETNLLGAMTATEVFLDQLRANGGGDLVNVSSVAGRVAPAGFAAYAATKWGINGWSEVKGAVSMTPALLTRMSAPPSSCCTRSAAVRPRPS
ncbi:MAG TPA: SDR family NAD(P)-dependent oxidoreductase [Beijerinckiaceae bacterium]